MKSEIDKNQEYVEQNIADILKAYRNKYILVYDQGVIDSFDTYERAINAGIKTYGLDGGILIHYVTENSVVNYVTSALL